MNKDLDKNFLASTIIEIDTHNQDLYREQKDGVSILLFIIIIHYYSLLFIIIYYYSLLFIIIHYYSLLFIIIH